MCSSLEEVYGENLKSAFDTKQHQWTRGLRAIGSIVDYICSVVGKRGLWGLNSWMDGEFEQCVSVCVCVRSFVRSCVCVCVLPALAPCYCFDVLFTDFEVMCRCEMKYF